MTSISGQKERETSPDKGRKKNFEMGDMWTEQIRAKHFRNTNKNTRLRKKVKGWYPDVDLTEEGSGRGRKLYKREEETCK